MKNNISFLHWNCCSVILTGTLSSNFPCCTKIFFFNISSYWLKELEKCTSPSVLSLGFFSTFPYQCCWPHSFIAILSQKFYSVLSQCHSLPVLLFILLIVGTDLAHTKVIGSLELHWVTMESSLRKLYCIKNFKWH